MKPKIILTSALLTVALHAPAQISTDGTLGPSLNLSGPNFQIGANLGQQHGPNLFHSFRDFNLSSHESATFSGPNSVQNVLSRVTGGNPSHIDGLFRSTISGANMYFLNPYGILFGPNARLDVQGSFHASTADYLRLGEDGRFDVRNPSDSILTVAPIESFGFLDNPHGTIEITGQRTDLENPRALLQVPDGKSLSLIGGEIHLSQGVDELPLEGLINDGTPEEIRAAQYRDQRYSQLYAPSGTLNLASIRQAGEIALTKNGIHSTAIQGGTIQLEQESYISSTGESGGNVFIRAGEFTMDNSTIYARTLGLQDGGVVDIQADNIKLNNLSKIRGGTENLGDGTDIQFSAKETIKFTDNSILNTYAGDGPHYGQVGNAGYIHLKAKDIEFNKIDGNVNGVFSTDTYGTGQGGDIHFIAENNINMVNESYVQTITWGTDVPAKNAGNIYLYAKNINLEASVVLTSSRGNGNAGKIVIKTGQLHLSKNGKILYASWLWSRNTASGNSGGITIQADEIVLEDGADVSTENIGSGHSNDIDIQTNYLTVRGADKKRGRATAIFSNAEGSSAKENVGNAGNINITAQEIRLEAGGQIAANSRSDNLTTSSGKAGNIVLNVKGKLVLSGVNPYGENVYGFGSVISARSQGNANGAGNIQIQAGSVSILEGALLQTGTDSHAHSGNISIQASELTISGNAAQIALSEPGIFQLDYLSNTNQQTYNESISGIYSNSTNRSINSGDSGHIEITTPKLILSNQGQISVASQGGGKAGQIILNVEKLVLDDNTLIRSNSDLINQFTFDSTTARDNHLITTGTVIKTLNVGDGKTDYQISIGDNLMSLPIFQVADMTELEHLPEQINIIDNQVVTVEDIGNGQSANFIYHRLSIYPVPTENWTKINEDSKVTLERATFQSGLGYVDGRKPPYPDGTQIHVKDIGNGKAADFIYIARPSINDNSKIIVVESSRVKNYQVIDSNALQQLTATTDLLTGTKVDVSKGDSGNPASFIFDGESWVTIGRELEVADIEARENLLLADAGHIAHLPEGDTIYTGRKWIDLGQTYRVNNLAERNSLNVQHGDLVKVADVGGRFDAFLYADDKWIQQIRGGDAGQIVINADSIQLTDGSEISTGSISGGGGSVTLNVDKMIYLTDSQVSTSVQEGVGNGGDLTINGSQFVIMNNGQIIAQANEGNGGNIRLGSKQLVKSPCSQISASSKLGVDGNVQIDSPAVDMDSFLVVLPGTPLPSEIPNPCRGITDPDQLSTFSINIEGEGMPTTPSSLME